MAGFGKPRGSPGVPLKEARAGILPTRGSDNIKSWGGEWRGFPSPHPKDDVQKPLKCKIDERQRSDRPAVVD